MIDTLHDTAAGMAFRRAMRLAGCAGCELRHEFSVERLAYMVWHTSVFRDMSAGVYVEMNRAERFPDSPEEQRLIAWLRRMHEAEAAFYAGEGA